MDLHFKEIALEDGYVRFLDRTTTPPFSEDISKLAVTVQDLSNKKSQRANLLMQALIGGDAALDVRGRAVRDRRADLRGHGRRPEEARAARRQSLRGGRARPGSSGAGELTTKLEYRIEEDKLDAKNDILVGNLRVAPAQASDEVKKRIGLPLGLIVALIKDGDGNIHVNVPISGTLSDKQFDFSDAIWTAVKQRPRQRPEGPVPGHRRPLHQRRRQDRGDQGGPAGVRGGQRGAGPGARAADGPRRPTSSAARPT